MDERTPGLAAAVVEMLGAVAAAAAGTACTVDVGTPFCGTGGDVLAHAQVAGGVVLLV
jgi:hypothetical protein